MHIKKVWLPATLAMMLILPAPGVYGQNSSGEESPKASQGWEDHHKEQNKECGKQKHDKHHHGMMIGTHKAAYYLLLAEKHTPSSLEQWKKALSEREILTEEFKSIWKSQHQKFKEAHEKVKKGEMTKDQFTAQIKEWKEEGKGRHSGWKENWKKIKEEHRAVHEEFTKAIESNDSKQINSALPKLLQLLQKENEIIKTNLNELKSKTK